jgi:hypothetical protein
MTVLAELYRDEASTLVGASDEDLQSRIWLAMQAMREQPEAASRFSHPEFEGSFEQGPIDAFRGIISVFVDSLHRQLYALVCGTKGIADRDRNALIRALGLDVSGRAAAIALILTSYAGVPPAIAPAAAVYIARKIVQPTLDGVCEAWSKVVFPETTTAAP